MSGIKQLTPGRWMGKPFVQVYTDGKTVDAEAHIARCVREDLSRLQLPAGRVPFDDEQLAANIRFHFPKPKSTKAPAPMGRRDDVDNLVKLVLDAIQPHGDWDGLICQDGAVTRLYSEKDWAASEAEVGIELEIVGIG